MKIKDRLLNEKRWYKFVITEEGFWNTTLRIPTFDRVKLEDKKHLVGKTRIDDGFEFRLNLSKDEKLVFDATYKNYILVFEPVDVNANVKTAVWK